MEEGSRLERSVAAIKIGHPLWSSDKRDSILEVLSDAPLMLDLKLHDIPSVATAAVEAACALCRPSLMTLHLDGGARMVEETSTKAMQCGTVLVGVTRLTSLSVEQDVVVKHVEVGLSWGLRYFVCAPQEIEAIRRRFGSGPRLIVPGIRESCSVRDDQRRIMSASRAWAAGADFLVVGRPVTLCRDPFSTLSALRAGMPEGR